MRFDVFFLPFTKLKSFKKKHVIWSQLVELEKSSIPKSWRHQTWIVSWVEVHRGIFCCGMWPLKTLRAFWCRDSVWPTNHLKCLQPESIQHLVKGSWQNHCFVKVCHFGSSSWLCEKVECSTQVFPQCRKVGLPRTDKPTRRWCAESGKRPSWKAARCCAACSSKWEWSAGLRTCVARCPYRYGGHWFRDAGLRVFE